MLDGKGWLIRKLPTSFMSLSFLGSEYWAFTIGVMGEESIVFLLIF